MVKDALCPPDRPQRRRESAVNRARFEELVREAVDGLPEPFARRLQNGQKRARHIFYVKDRPPSRTVTLQVDLTCGKSPGYKIVQHQIKAKARRDAIGRATPQKCRAEVFVC